MGYDPSLDDASRSAQANTAVGGSLSGMSKGYFDAFYAHWISDADHSNPSARAERAIQSSEVSSFINSMPSSQQQLMFAVQNHYLLSNYGDAATREFAVSTVGQSITDPTMKQQLYTIYDLGANVPGAVYDNMVIASAPSEQQGAVRDIINLGRNPSDGAIGNYLVGQALKSVNQSDTNATDIIRDAWNLGAYETDADFDKYVVDKASKDMNASQKAQIAEIYGWGPNPNSSVIRDFVLEQAGNGHNASENQTMAEIFDLGYNATPDTIKNYVIDQAKKTCQPDLE